MTKYIGGVIYFFGCVGGDATVAWYFASIVGWDGAPGVFAAFFCTAVGIAPLIASIRGNNWNFRALNTVLAFALSAACVVPGVQAFRLLRAHSKQSAAVASVQATIKDSRASGMRGRDAVEAGKVVAGVVNSTKEQEDAKKELTEPAWLSSFNWVAGFFVAGLFLLLLFAYIEEEDADKDGTPDFLQKKKKPANQPKDYTEAEFDQWSELADDAPPISAKSRTPSLDRVMGK
jgi:hypothetical protein